MRVVIAEDSALVREGLRNVLEAAGFDVAAAVNDGEAAVAAVDEHRPDLVVLDVRMPPTFTAEGADAAARIKALDAGIGVVLLSQRIEPTTALALAKAHKRGFGYLLKDRVFDLDRFFDDLRTVAAGGTAMDDEVVDALLQSKRREETLTRLTEREREVLALLAGGRSNAAIASALFLNAKTVETHIASIFTKLGLLPDPAENRRVLAVLTFLDDH